MPNDNVPNDPVLETARLVLRPWRDADVAPYVALCTDPEVMRYFPTVPTTEAAAEQAARLRAGVERDGYGLWATEVRATGEFIGFVGLAVPSFEAPFTPCMEVGWRLARSVWGRGYAPEAAGAALEFGFVSLKQCEIVSFTSTTNLPSQRVMKKLGMRTDPREDFDHPALPDGHPLRRHVLYRIDERTWRDWRARRLAS